MSVLEARNLVKSYGHRTVVQRVNLKIISGEIIGLLGRNGAGKTTVFQMIVGLMKPDEGDIYLDEKDISQTSSDQRALAGLTYLPQEHSVFLKASVENNIRLGLELQPLPKEKRDEMIRELLAEFDLLPLARQSAHSLSGGERRRLEICRALILKPKFLLLDEPFTGIDPLTVLELQKILVNLKKKGIGVLLSDHNVRDTFKIASRAYIIDEGEILIEDTPIKIASDEKARERFLGESFQFGEELLL